MRYEHFLPQSRPSPWPGAVLCLSCDVSWSPRQGTAARQYALLARWHVRLCVRQGEVYSVVRTASGRTSDGFWECLKTASHRGRNVWVISTEFRAASTVLGLWERMENGAIQLAGKDSRRSRASRSMPDVQGKDKGAHPLQPDALGRGRAARNVPAGVPAQKRPVKGGSRGDRASARGVCILEDPPIVLEITLDGGGGKITWVDAANYGVTRNEHGQSDSLPADKLATWFVSAASTLHTLGRCGWQHTAGSQAMHLFRAVYHETPILCHTSAHATALERGGHFGGRCEPFQLGRVAGPVHLYDFRSLYPYIYSTECVPVRLVSESEKPSVARILESDSREWWIAKVDIETDEPEYPYRAGNAVIYPVGRYTTVLCGPELRRAAETDRIVRVRRAARYEAESALKRYAEAIYALRCDADARHDEALSSYVKRIMNCLHGKFGQREAKWEDVPGAETPWEWAEWHMRSESGELERWRAIAGNVQRETKEGYSHGSVPAIACAVASAARDRLMSAIQRAGWDHVYYCDTDAVIVDDEGAESLSIGDWIRPGEWGYLQHVISADECTIYGVKHYEIGGRMRQSGRINGGRPTIAGESAVARQPGIRERLTVQLPPADWREAHPRQPGPGRYDPRRGAGGRVRPNELDEWEPS